MIVFFFCKQKTAYEMRISDWSSDVCSSDLKAEPVRLAIFGAAIGLGFLAGKMRSRLQRSGVKRRALAGRHEREDRAARRGAVKREIGRASCRERVCKYV